MKCIFALSDSDCEYRELARVLVLSAHQHTDLDLFCIYDGADVDFQAWLKTQMVSVLPWRVSFFEELEACYRGKMSLDFCRGTYLCMEIPRILRHYGILDEYILYVDVDVMFTGAVELEGDHPPLFSASFDWEIGDSSRYSTGVMLMNAPGMMLRYPAFVEHLRHNRFNFEYAGMGPCDQGAWNTFYRGEHQILGPKYDWKPWWGHNDDARIVHFSGPKPRLASRFLAGMSPMTDREHLHYFVVNRNREAYRMFLEQWFAY